MGQSTDAILVFGVSVPEGEEPEWLRDMEAQEWWRVQQGYEPPYRPYTEEGEYAEGWTPGDPRLPAYFQHGWDWDKANPCPFDALPHCSGDYPMYILAVPGTETRAWRGSPVAITELRKVEMGDEYQDAVGKLGFDAGAAQWWLCSMWS